MRISTDNRKTFGEKIMLSDNDLLDEKILSELLFLG